MRSATIERDTTETSIRLTWNLDGTGQSNIQTQCGFLDHMLTLFARHGGFDLSLTCQGDTHVDYHHTVEDVGICLGQALQSCLGDKRGIRRYGHIILPMDETLMLCAIDLSGRGHLGMEVSIPTPKVGDFDTELVEEFMLAFIRHSQITLHFQQLAGKNTHHIIEGMFKAFGRALQEAVRIDPSLGDAIPSTKGSLSS